MLSSDAGPTSALSGEAGRSAARPQTWRCRTWTTDTGRSASSPGRCRSTGVDVDAGSPDELARSFPPWADVPSRRAHRVVLAGQSGAQPGSRLRAWRWRAGRRIVRVLAPSAGRLVIEPSRPRRSTRRYRRLRAFVLRRDGGRCVRCGGVRRSRMSPCHSADCGRTRYAVQLSDAVPGVS